MCVRQRLKPCLLITSRQSDAQMLNIAGQQFPASECMCCVCERTRFFQLALACNFGKNLLQDPDMPLWVSDSAQDFLSKTLVKDPSKRSKASELVKHPWLKSLGLKAPAGQVPSSIAVVEPILQPRVVIIEPEPEISQVVVPEATSDKQEQVPVPAPLEIMASTSGNACAQFFRVCMHRTQSGTWSHCCMQVAGNSIFAYHDVQYYTAAACYDAFDWQPACVLQLHQHHRLPHQARVAGKHLQRLQQQILKEAGICSTKQARPSQKQKGIPWWCQK